MSVRSFLRFPVISEGAEVLVQGNLMRRNILTYKAPPGNEGYDLICIHPDPRYKPRKGQKAQVRVQVKSRYQTDCDRGFPVKEASLGAFDFLIVAFMNVGNFYRGRDGSTGAASPEFYTFPARFIRRHHDTSSSWAKVKLKRMEHRLARYRDETGFEQIAEALGISRPTRPKAARRRRKGKTR